MEWLDQEVMNEKMYNPDEEFYDRFRVKMNAIMQVLVRDCHDPEDYRSFNTRRHEWCVAGSSGGEKIWVPDDSALAKHSGNPTSYHADKRSYMESITVDEMCSWLDDEPREFAKGTEKHENGKIRPIYGVDVKHYTISCYATAGLEERMHLIEGLEKGLTGLKEFVCMQKKSSITIGHQHQCSMLDYADFNIQHSNKAQAILFEELAKVGEEKGYHAECG